MSTSLAYITQEPDPQVPLLSDAVHVDPQTQVQREVQANLQNEIESVIEPNRRSGTARNLTDNPRRDASLLRLARANREQSSQARHPPRKPLTPRSPRI